MLRIWNITSLSLPRNQEVDIINSLVGQGKLKTTLLQEELSLLRLSDEELISFLDDKLTNSNRRLGIFLTDTNNLPNFLHEIPRVFFIYVYAVLSRRKNTTRTWREFGGYMRNVLLPSLYNILAYSSESSRVIKALTRNLASLIVAKKASLFDAIVELKTINNDHNDFLLLRRLYSELKHKPSMEVTESLIRYVVNHDHENIPWLFEKIHSNTSLWRTLYQLAKLAYNPDNFSTVLAYAIEKYEDDALTPISQILVRMEIDFLTLTLTVKKFELDWNMVLRQMKLFDRSSLTTKVLKSVLNEQI